MPKYFKKIRRGEGQLSLEVIFFAAVVVIVMTGFIFWALSFLKLSVRSFYKSMAFSIAEGGIEYYRWHLAHAPTDYFDGQGSTSTGPYVHDYYDKNGQKIGSYTLEITPPPAGSTIVTVKSTGKVVADDSVDKIIEVKMGIPSLGKYAILSNESVRFGTGTFVYGPLHSNDGVRFDGIAYNLVTSAKTDYDDPDHGGANEIAVHTHIAPVDPFPPTAPQPRPDVFTAGRQFPVPAIDFNSLTANLSQIKSLAQASGTYVGSSTTGLGYHVVLKTNDTFDLYRVDKLESKPPGCTDIQGQDGWGTWTIKDQTFLQNYLLPVNGVVFIEDDFWIDGQINTARVTFAAGRFPENSATDKTVTINNDLLYTNYDGQDVIGVIAQKNVNIGLMSEDDLRVDGALVAKNGRIGRYYYRPPTSQGQGGQNCQAWNVRAKITTYGMLATNKRYGFAYTDGTGYLIRNLNYDANLLYGPPPSFPLVGDAYTQISWEEIK